MNMEITAGQDLFTKEIFSNKFIDLCGNYTMNANGGICPYDDGDYLVEFDYEIPSTGTFDWFFTGYTLNTKIQIYSDENNTDMLGDCSAIAKLATSGTVAIADRTITTPSSAVAFMAVLGTLVLGIACASTRKKDANKDNEKTIELLSKEDGAHPEDPDAIERARSAFTDDSSARQMLGSSSN